MKTEVTRQSLIQIIDDLNNKRLGNETNIWSTYDHFRGIDCLTVWVGEWVNPQLRLSISTLDSQEEDRYVEEYAEIAKEYLGYYHTNLPKINKEDIGFTHGHLTALVRDGFNVIAVIKMPTRNIIRIMNEDLYELMLGNPVTESSGLIMYARYKQIESLLRSVDWGRIQEVQDSVLAKTDVYLPCPIEDEKEVENVSRIDRALVNLMFGLRETLIHEYD